MNKFAFMKAWNLKGYPWHEHQRTYEWRKHGSEPGHGAGEGEGHGPHHRGEQLRGVQVHDSPAHLHSVLRSGDM